MDLNYAFGCGLGLVFSIGIIVLVLYMIYCMFDGWLW